MQLHPQHRIQILGGTVIDPASGLNEQKDVFIENDVIVAVGKKPVDFQVEKTIDATGKLVLPGFIDLCAFLAEPGFGQKGNIASETKAAARSGITTLCCAPDTKPVIDSSAVANLITDKAKEAGNVRVLPLGALTAGLQGEQLSNMNGLKEAGCVALTNMDAPMRDSRVVMQCYHYAAGVGMPVMVTPLDHALADGGCMHQGPTSTRLGLAGIPETAETVALAQHLLLIEQTGVTAHFNRISSGLALEMITNAKAKGLNVSADVAIGNLCFIDEDSLGFDSAMHVVPPYRSEADRQALLAGVNAGELAICSNHRPHEVAAKMAPFAASESGISVLDSFASVLFSLVEKGELTLEAAVKAVTQTPADVLGETPAEAMGSLKVGGAADVTIIDQSATIELNEADLNSQGVNNPWLHQSLKGKVLATLCDGHVVFEV